MKITNKNIIPAAATALILMVFQLNISSAPPLTNDIEIVSIEFVYGNGKGPTNYGENYSQYYYRSYNSPGTLISIRAQMNVSGILQPMYGDVTLNVQYSNGVNTGTFPVYIRNGENSGSAIIPYNELSGFSSSWISSGTTASWTYSVTSASGTFCSGIVNSSIAPSILWDREDPPCDADFPPQTEAEVGVDLTATTAKLYWQPVTTDTGSGGRNNEDFYEYRIKFRQISDDNSFQWRTWDGNEDPTLRHVSKNPTSVPLNDPALHFDNGRKYTLIPNLKIFTQYEYYIQAVDVFGNASAPPPAYLTFATQPYSVDATISDGINQYDDFSNLADPTLRNVRASNIKVTIEVVSSEEPPESIRIWYTAVDDSVSMVAENQSIDTQAFEDNTVFSVDGTAESANEWTAYLSSDTQAITEGNTVRFVVETITGGISAFADSDTSDLDPNDDEWTFYVGKSMNFEPQPVRILNNVIDNKNPKAYPSYYLTDDAYVTIRVYDVKGRQVSSILEDGFRRGGQNIKENGWRGINKAGRKLGVGLYYIKIRAKRASDGKIILDETKKVVMAK